MDYLSICSGIEAASTAWEPLGWNPVGFAEVEPFCRALLKYYWPGVHNHGDFTRIVFPPAADVLVAGTPCQDFSVAGLRAGLDGARGNLTLEWLAFVERSRFRWLVWENVPGVLSVDEGRAFPYILGQLAKFGYGFAYRILDAQYFGVPQRRRRIFVVGYLGDWRPAAAVLFERASLHWNPAPRREARENIAGPLGSLPEGGFRTTDLDGQGAYVSHAVRPRQESKCNDADRIDYVPEVVRTLDASYGRLQGASNQDLNHGLSHLVAYGGNRQSGSTGVATAVRAHGSSHQDFETETFVVAHTLRGRDYKGPSPEADSSTVVVAHTLRADGFDASEDGTGRGPPLVTAFYPTEGRDFYGYEDVSPTIKVGTGLDISSPPAIAFRTNQTGAQGSIFSEEVTDTLAQDHPPAVAFKENQRAEVTADETAALNIRGGKPGQGYPAILSFTERSRPDGRNLEFSEGTAYALTNPGSGGRTHSRQVLHQARVRRLTPLECERLQGFPDHYTRIRYRGKPAADGPRYRALGNSMAVPVMRWLGERIQAVEELLIKLGRPDR